MNQVSNPGRMVAITVSRRYHPWPGYVLGFALGGFFDGILLHQILQRHHLLSAINGDDIRFQVAADGYFHALMYVIAVVGLWMLWTARHDPGRRSGRRLGAGILIGFGIWHIVDAVLSHWTLGLHRIRMDSGTPLFWDLLWLGLFGVVPTVLGWSLNGPRDDGRQIVCSSGPNIDSSSGSRGGSFGNLACERKRIHHGAVRPGYRAGPNFQVARIGRCPAGLDGR
ncbi:DUF2243 domain-containing protein [Microvirga sp. BT689]|uniref:DUF2243 domain-containing protein n=1 Tax=Microvirga arvi TaxID=2778731 RepID=UPI00194F3F08|nr:DUF2243 domain-containing protein [Microvirga arvi]MBM6582003.1 DUF2243 domain-containing protein [Microvirga arvi]